MKYRNSNTDRLMDTFLSIRRPKLIFHVASAVVLDQIC